MWMLLCDEDEAKEGDERHYENDGWIPISKESAKLLNRLGFSEGSIRRELKGWEAVEYALRQEVLGNDKEGCETTEDYWDCECNDDYIRTADELDICLRCGAARSGQPDSHKAEVILKIINEGRLS